MGVDIPDRLELDHVHLACPLRLDRCRFQAGASLNGGTLAVLSLNGSWLAADTTNVDNPALALGGAKITGSLSMSGATLSNEGGVALLLDRATIEGGVFLDKGFTAAGEVSATDATITGSLSMSAAILSNEGGVALLLDRATIEGGVFLDKGFTATGEVRAMDAAITGSLSMMDATLSNEGGVALLLDRATMKGGAFLHRRFTATGEVRAIDATTTTWAMTGATLLGASGSGKALILEDMEVGALFLRGIGGVYGEVHLSAARIGDLVLDATGMAVPGGS